MTLQSCQLLIHFSVCFYETSGGGGDKRQPRKISVIESSANSVFHLQLSQDYSLCSAIHFYIGPCQIQQVQMIRKAGGHILGKRTFLEYLRHSTTVFPISFIIHDPTLLSSASCLQNISLFLLKLNNLPLVQIPNFTFKMLTSMVICFCLPYNQN